MPLTQCVYSPPGTPAVLWGHAGGFEAQCVEARFLPSLHMYICIRSMYRRVQVVLVYRYALSIPRLLQLLPSALFPQVESFRRAAAAVQQQQRHHGLTATAAAVLAVGFSANSFRLTADAGPTCTRDYSRDYRYYDCNY